MKDGSIIDMMDVLFGDSNASGKKARGNVGAAKTVKDTARNIEQQHIYNGYEYVSGLLYREPKPLKTQGRCGMDGECIYDYYTGMDIVDYFIPMLQRIARKKLEFAYDYETGPCKIRDIDPVTGEWLTDLDWSTLGNKTGSDPHSSPIFILAISTKYGESHAVDVREARKHPLFIQALRDAVTQAKPISHNSVFEGVFTKTLCDVFPVCWGDPLVETHITYAGLPDPLVKWIDPRKPPKLKADLASCLEREMNVKIKKKVRDLFTLLHPECGLTDEQMAYACGDVSYLLELNDIMRRKMEDLGILQVWDQIEAPFLPLISEQRYYGVPVDLGMILSFRKEAMDEVTKLRDAWNQNHPTIDPHSNPTVLQYFQEKYPVLDITQVDEKTLSKLFEEDEKTGDFVSGDKDAYDILQMRGIEKIHSTYLDPWVKSKRHPITGCIHPDFWQAATATGRLSCSKPNMQNIPSKGKWKKIRHCIVSIPGHLLVDRDLSQFEVRALADMAGEEKMMDMFREADKVESRIMDYWKKEWGVYGEDAIKKFRSGDETLEALAKELDALDFHRLNAQAIFGKAFDESDDDGKKEFRKRAKVLTFAIPYGSGPTKIADTFKVSKERGQELIDKYYDTWPNIARFLTKCRLMSVKKKYTKTPIGRKRFYALGERFKDEDKRRIRASVERQATNHPIQGINGDVLKLASILVHPTLRKCGARILLWVHDEILILCPIEYVDIVHLELDRCMKLAAIQCNMVKCPVKTSLEIGTAWSH